MKLCHLLWISLKIGLQYRNNWPYLTEDFLDISDLPFVQNKEYQYIVSHLDNLKKLKKR